MAMGADEAILVEADDNLDSFRTAKALKGAIEKSGNVDIDIYIEDVQMHGSDALDIIGIQENEITYSSKVEGLILNKSLISKPGSKKVLVISKLWYQYLTIKRS